MIGISSSILFASSQKALFHDFQYTFFFSSAPYPAIWRCGASFGRCGCGGYTSLKEAIHLLWEICSHLQISGYVALFSFFIELLTVVYY
jgi:hypothetical protein